MPPSPAGPPPDATRPGGREPPGGVTTTDLLKAAGLVLVFVDHYGLFFDEGQTGWRVVGRLAAPIFFFLLGYARSRRVPLSWPILGAALTVIDLRTSGEAWWEAQLNILFSFAALRLVLPLIERHVVARPARLVLLVAVTIALIRPLEPFLEYGMEGWLWAYFGLAARLAGGEGAPEDRAAARRSLALAGVAALAYFVAERSDLELGSGRALALAVLLAGLAAVLLAFRRRPAVWQPGGARRALLRFAGRHSIVIYALGLASMQIASYLLDEDDEE